jgi:hypothetical protein
LRIAVDESLLDRRLMRRIIGDHPHQPFMQVAQPRAHRLGGVGLQAAAVDKRKARALTFDDPPACVAQAGIDAKDANRSIGHAGG